jgi:hypothetical protein
MLAPMRNQNPNGMNSILRTSVTLVALLSLTACSSTRFTTTWKASDAVLINLQPGDSVGALVIHPEVAVRRAAEDALAAELTARGLRGVTAYSILGEAEPRDEAAAREAFAKSGVNAVVVMRGIGEATEVDYVAPSYSHYTSPSYRGFWGGYYGPGWATVYDPGYLRTYKVVTVESLVYDLKTNQLVWGGRSRTVDPRKLDTFIREIVDEAAKEMKKAGVL